MLSASQDQFSIRSNGCLNQKSLENAEIQFLGEMDKQHKPTW